MHHRAGQMRDLLGGTFRHLDHHLAQHAAANDLVGQRLVAQADAQFAGVHGRHVAFQQGCVEHDLRAGAGIVDRPAHPLPRLQHHGMAVLKETDDLAAGSGRLPRAETIGERDIRHHLDRPVKGVPRPRRGDGHPVLRQAGQRYENRHHVDGADGLFVLADLFHRQPGVFQRRAHRRAVDRQGQLHLAWAMMQGDRPLLRSAVYQERDPRHRRAGGQQPQRIGPRHIGAAGLQRPHVDRNLVGNRHLRQHRLGEIARLGLGMLFVAQAVQFGDLRFQIGNLPRQDLDFGLVDRIGIDQVILPLDHVQDHLVGGKGRPLRGDHRQPVGLDVFHHRGDPLRRQRRGFLGFLHQFFQLRQLGQTLFVQAGDVRQAFQGEILQRRQHLGSVGDQHVTRRHPARRGGFLGAVAVDLDLEFRCLFKVIGIDLGQLAMHRAQQQRVFRHRLGIGHRRDDLAWLELPLIRGEVQHRARLGGANGAHTAGIHDQAKAIHREGHRHIKHRQRRKDQTDRD